MGTARVPCHQAGLLVVPRWGAGGTGADRACLRPQTTVSPTPAGTFRAAGCGPLRPGTVRAFGDRIPVPDGVEGPRPHENVPGRDDMSPDARSAPTSTACLHPPEPHIQPHQHEGPVAVGLSTNHNRPRERTLNRPSAAA